MGSAAAVRGILAAAILLASPAWSDSPEPRIVSLAPHLTELAYAAGIDQQLVGAVEWSDYPEAARRLPRIGDAFRFDLEAIVRLGTSDALAWQDGTPQAAIDALQELGITVHPIQTRSLAGIADALEQIGALGGQAALGAEAAHTFRARLETFIAAAGRSPEEVPIRVLYQVAERPLFTLGGRHVINEVLGLCGAVNVFGDIDAAALTIDFEAALAQAPLAIVAGSPDADPTSLAAWRSHGSTPASRCDHLLAVDPELLVRPTPRIVEGAERLCAWLDETVRRDPRPECRPKAAKLP
ncbi:MAG: cobalamin-binding protein [Gammaproteobacteria bacterium HGW-Gammaproteobacteria-8]|nr:MAG: cobalamin-binding protein [Gammaproteobacteria bacterium HGW-Gammaproteobacteria-8]